MIQIHYNTSRNKHQVTIHKKYGWIHSKVTITSTLSHPLHTACPFNQGKRQKPSGKILPYTWTVKKNWKYCHQSCFTSWSSIPSSDLILLKVFSQKTLVKMFATSSEYAQKSRTMVPSYTSTNHTQVVWCSAYGYQCAWFAVSELDHCIFEWFSYYHSR